MSWFFPTTLHLAASAADAAPPQGIAEVMKTLLKNIVDNPVKALMSANYIGILGWALIIGGALRHAPMNTKEVMESISQAITTVVGWIIRFAPLGIMGLVADSIATNGIEALISYFQLLVLLLGSMIFVALVINPLLSFIYLRRNPYPLVFKCLRESAIYAFFTRSSAANIPVNLDLAKRLKLNPDMYSVSIPLGATINMGGAAITITVMTFSCCSYIGHHRGCTYSYPSIRYRYYRRLRRFWRSRRLLASHSVGMFPIRYLQRCGYASSRRWFHHRGITRLHRNSTQFQYRYSLHCYCRLCKTWLSRKLGLNHHIEQDDP